MIKVAETLALDGANARAVRWMVERLSDAEVLAVYELSEGEGAIADLAADQMQVRNLDF